MDQLVTRIKELQPNVQKAEDQVATARTAYYNAIDSAHELLKQLHSLEHELLVNVLNQRAGARPPTIPEESASSSAPPRPSSVTDN